MALKVLPVLLLLCALTAGAQETTATPFEARDPLFHVMSDRGSDDAAQLIKEMELRFNFYNRYFRYDTAALSPPLRVRAFGDRESYDAYVRARLGTVRNGAVYLHYADPARRELVIHRGSPEERLMLPRESFIQFFRAFVTNPPSWLREGFAIYFSSLRYDPVLGELDYTENLAWLDRVKTLGSRSLSLELVLLADSLGIPENFQQLSWALVSFFLNTGSEDYFRTLAEIILLLPGNASSKDNAELAARHISRWNDMDTLKRDYNAYIASRKTFNDLLREGQRAFAEKDLITAEVNFSAALNQRPGHHSPYYYLGLISYERKDYATAEDFYRLALEKGADQGLVFYARGINAFSAGRRPEAEEYLGRAAEADPDRYGERAAAIIGRL
ncbi:MAG: hypothetical protein LBQ35_05010, partial [Spirochaetaceae bacterium]|nr:hypothetical protein [Spirochaetaceae bacterium]